MKILDIDLLEWSSHEQQSAVELLQENNSLAAVFTGEENENGTGGDGSAERCLAGGLARDFGTGNVLGWVVLGGLGGRDQSLLSVRLSSNSLLSVRRCLCFGGRGRSLLA